MRYPQSPKETVIKKQQHITIFNIFNHLQQQKYKKKYFFSIDINFKIYIHSLIQKVKKNKNNFYKNKLTN